MTARTEPQLLDRLRGAGREGQRGMVKVAER